MRPISFGRWETSATGSSPIITSPYLRRQWDLHIIDGYVGRGYALSRRKELALLCIWPGPKGIFLDPVL